MKLFTSICARWSLCISTFWRVCSHLLHIFFNWAVWFPLGFFMNSWHKCVVRYMISECFHSICLFYTHFYNCLLLSKSFKFYEINFAWFSFWMLILWELKSVSSRVVQQRELLLAAWASHMDTGSSPGCSASSTASYAADTGLTARAPHARMGDLNAAPGPALPPGPALAIAASCGVNQKVERSSLTLCLSVSL